MPRTSVRGEVLCNRQAGIDHGGYLPTLVRIAGGKRPDLEAARVLGVPRGSVVVADRAYVDFTVIPALRAMQARSASAGLFGPGGSCRISGVGVDSTPAKHG